jgi:hypothetical protein
MGAKFYHTKVMGFRPITGYYEELDERKKPRLIWSSSISPKVSAIIYRGVSSGVYSYSPSSLCRYLCLSIYGTDGASYYNSSEVRLYKDGVLIYRFQNSVGRNESGEIRLRIKSGFDKIELENIYGNIIRFAWIMAEDCNIENAPSEWFQ